MSPDARYDSLIAYYAEQHALDWRRIKRQLVAESSLDRWALSHAGAAGLAQFTAATWSDLWRDDPRWADPRPSRRPSVFCPEDAIGACCRYMAQLYEAFEEIPDTSERYRFALASYNAGKGSINQCLQLARQACDLPGPLSEWVQAGRKPGPWQQWDYASRSLSLVTGEHARETIAYVKRIMAPEAKAVAS